VIEVKVKERLKALGNDAVLNFLVVISNILDIEVIKGKRKFIDAIYRLLDRRPGGARDPFSLHPFSLA
jgi:hypothetical protein